MTETLQRLQGIGDSDFEKLVAYYLRQHEPLLTDLIATGINEDAKPIPCPIDGIVYVPGDPPTCVAVAYTTIALSGLKGKWLGTKGDKGDIAKAADEFREWQASDETVRCVLYLATNRLLKNKLDVYREAIERGKVSRIEVRIVEASQVEPYLDIDPQGQYWREKLFGIPVERLSERLLREIGQESLAHHRRTFELDTGSPDIQRDAYVDVLRLVDDRRSMLLGVRGASGTGKSTLVGQVAAEMQGTGGVALWIPADTIPPGVSLARLLLDTLHRFRPSLGAHAGDEAVRLASHLPRGLTLIVDDVNRLPSPRWALLAVSGWRADPAIAATSLVSAPGRSAVIAVVPLWPGQLADDDSPFRKADGWSFVDLASYSPGERSLLATRLSDTGAADARTLIDALDGDPLLCGLAAAEPGLAVGADHSRLMRRIFDGALRRAAAAACTVSATAITRNEVIAALDALIDLTLHMTMPEPAWDMVRSALDDRTVAALRSLAQTERLGWIEQGDGGDAWRWKHERLRDALVGRRLAARGIIAPGIEIEEGDLTLLSHPGLAEAWALAVCFLSDSAVQEHALVAFADHHPLALVEVLRLGLFPHQPRMRAIIEAGLHRALDGAWWRVPRQVASPQDHIVWALAHTRDPLVLSVTQDQLLTRQIAVARVRNGDLATAVAWIDIEMQGGMFPPALIDSFFEEAVAACAQYHEHDRDAVRRALLLLGRHGSLGATVTLAGYIGWAELAPPLWDMWDALPEQNKLDTLIPVLWMVCRCGDTTIRPAIEATLILARRLSTQDRVQDNANLGSERHWRFAEPLKHVQRWPVTPSAVDAFAEVFATHPDLQATLAYVLRAMDYPVTMTAYVRWIAQTDRTIWDWLATPHDETLPQASATRDALWHIVRGEEPEAVRHAAFDKWRRAVTSADIARLWDILPTDPLFEKALHARAALRDRTAAEPIIARLRADPPSWCLTSAHLYNEPGVADALFNTLTIALADEHERATTIAEYLPPDGVKRLIQTYRDDLLTRPKTWASLWRTGLPEAVLLVQHALTHVDAPTVRYFFMNTTSLPFPVSEDMLDALVPVLDRFGLNERRDLIHLAVKSGLTAWVRAYLPDMLMPGSWWYYLLTEAGIRAALDEAAAALPEGTFAVVRTPAFSILTTDEMTTGDVMDVLRAWLGPTPYTQRWVLAAMVTEERGTGDDIDWWRVIEPTDEGLREDWRCVLYTLERRRWHG